MPPKPDRNQYTIGWIAPLPLEFKPARAALDEDYGEIDVDNDSYRGGKIGQHYVVMAIQTKMGTEYASNLAAKMYATFKNIRCFFVVGLGGGVPRCGPVGDLHEIVLGDVVVSYPRGNYGGIAQYDVGAWRGKVLETSGHMNGPSDFLLGVANRLQSDQTDVRTRISTTLKEMRKKIPEDQYDFEDQGAEKDRLFDDTYIHRDKHMDCEGHCDLNQSQTRRSRGTDAERPLDTPRIHYGIIGSSHQLQTSALSRNYYHKEHGIICYEMEGAGVMQSYPCLVIRGICDYSDSHKNKKWQPYAAATAAAYAKVFICSLPSGRQGVPTDGRSHGWTAYKHTRAESGIKNSFLKSIFGSSSTPTNAVDEIRTDVVTALKELGVHVVGSEGNRFHCICQLTLRDDESDDPRNKIVDIRNNKDVLVMKDGKGRKWENVGEEEDSEVENDELFNLHELVKLDLIIVKPSLLSKDCVKFEKDPEGRTKTWCYNYVTDTILEELRRIRRK